MAVSQHPFPPGATVKVYKPAAVEVDRQIHREPTAAAEATAVVTPDGTLNLPSAATVVLGEVDDDNALRYTAKDVGADGNAITVAYVDPEGNNESLGVSVDDGAITVSLATDGSGDITSTAADVLAAVEAENDADELVSVVDEGDSDGSGVVEAEEATALAGGGPAGPGRYTAAGSVPKRAQRNPSDEKFDFVAITLVE